MTEGDEVVLDSRPGRVTAVNAEAQTFCVVFSDGGWPEREHGIPLGALAQRWVCEAPLDQ